MSAKSGQVQCLRNMIKAPEAVRAKFDEVDINGVWALEFYVIFQGYSVANKSPVPTRFPRGTDQ